MEDKLARRFYLKEFRAISHAICTYEDLDLLMSHLVEGTTKTFQARGCSIMLLDEREKQLFHVRSYGISEDYIRKGPVLVEDPYCAVCTGEPVYFKDIQHDERVQYPKAAAKEGIVSMLSVPIKSRSNVIGILRVYHGEDREFHEADVETLQVLAEQLGLVIELNGLKNFLDTIKMALENLPLRMLEGY
ncbi:MAG TPA: GAF domain-containing protein [Desulfobacteraceae bacterium]|nr:GAF domain-containing protein [Desulfobacteraceae bacterium]